MDASLILSAVLGLAGGLTAAGGLLWKLSAQLTAQAEQIKSLKEEQRKQEESCKEQFERLNTEFDDYVKEQGNAWQQLNRTLGKIEGALERPAPPPAPPPRRSAP